MGSHVNYDRLPPNEPRGAIEEMSEEKSETEAISAGPLLSRLLSMLRAESGENMGGTVDTNGSVNGDSLDIDESAPPDAHASAVTRLPESLQPGWKAPSLVGKPDYASLETRAMLELHHLGMVGGATEPNHDDHLDDDVAARLRFLQAELRRQAITNGARKARLFDLTMERIAQQEYNTIAEDLDNQLNAAYLKRNRHIGKGKKNTKRPGGAGGGSHSASASVGLAKPSVGEPIRILMERRGQWIQTIGPVVDYGKAGLPVESVFRDEIMKQYEEKEQELWNEQA